MNIPQPPQITTEAMARCQDTGDYASVLFEWYKYVGILCAYYSSIRRESPALHPTSPLHYAVLAGLLNRCARLMYSNVVLSREGWFGETTAILDRCIFESALKVVWLCTRADGESFTRFIASGLKAELELKEKITDLISQRGGPQLEIEKRMLDSIQNYVNSSGLNKTEIRTAKDLPNLASMIDTIGQDRLLYIIGQKLGSHHVHGTWSSLITHYLEEKDGELRPGGHKYATDINQYVFVPLIVLQALRAFVKFICREQGSAEAWLKLFETVSEEIHQIHTKIAGHDFEPVHEGKL
jgi:hypothetical protein